MLLPPAQNPHKVTSGVCSQVATPFAPPQTDQIGFDANATVRLYLTPPGGVEQLLAEETLALEPFQNATLRGQFTPQASGRYLVRAEAIANDPTDPDTTNNTRTWAFTFTNGLISDIWIVR